MVYIPVRKLYFLAKVSLLIILVVTVLALFEVWRGGKRKAAADVFEEEYEQQIVDDEARIIPGLGEGGVAAYLTGDDKLKGEESEKKLAMNVYLSERIAYNRSLSDKRNPACSRVKYDAELPSASVILIFHNEPYSVVVRTIWSVINSCRRTNPWFHSQTNFIDRDGRKMQLGYPGQDPNSALVYLKEIVLVDDNSTLPELKGKLSHYVRTRLPPDLIRILRLPDRVGLTQARMAGARASAGDILIVLDSHSEGMVDWLRPLLHRIKYKRDAVLTPFIDIIDHKSFELIADSDIQMVRHYIRKKVKPYSLDQLLRAVEDVRKKKINSYQAADVYGIPRSTIISRLYETRAMNDKPGRPTVFSIDFEKKMAEYLHIMEKNGFPLTRKETKILISEYVRRNGIVTPFKNDIPGKDWFHGFQKRNNLSIKKPQPVEMARRKACDPFIIYGYFDILEKVVEELGLSENPKQIYNLDETSLCSDPVKGKVLGKVGYRSTRTTSGPGRNNTTVLLAINANGDKVPALIIFQGKHLWSEWLYKNKNVKTAYSVSEKGWMETSIFEKYLRETFVPAIGKERPVLLIFDGHTTHVDLNVIKYAASEGITILKLPPHSSHILQPLDCSTMKPLKDRWEDKIIQWQRLHIGVKLPKGEFARLLTEVWDEINPVILQNGFKRTGVYPVNRFAIPKELFDILTLKKWENAQAQLVKEDQHQPEDVMEPDVMNCAEHTDESSTIIVSSLLTLTLKTINEHQSQKHIEIETEINDNLTEKNSRNGFETKSSQREEKENSVKDKQRKTLPQKCEKKNNELNKEKNSKEILQIKKESNTNSKPEKKSKLIIKESEKILRTYEKKENNLKDKQRKSLPQKCEKKNNELNKEKNSKEILQIKKESNTNSKPEKKSKLIIKEPEKILRTYEKKENNLKDKQRKSLPQKCEMNNIHLDKENNSKEILQIKKESNTNSKSDQNSKLIIKEPEKILRTYDRVSRGDTKESNKNCEKKNNIIQLQIPNRIDSSLLPDSLKILKWEKIQPMREIIKDVQEPNVSFEELLLKTVRRNDLPKTQKKRILNSKAEVLTYDDVLKRMTEDHEIKEKTRLEKLKKKEAKIQNKEINIQKRQEQGSKKRQQRKSGNNQKKKRQQRITETDDSNSSGSYTSLNNSEDEDMESYFKSILLEAEQHEDDDISSEKDFVADANTLKEQPNTHFFRDSLVLSATSSKTPDRAYSYFKIQDPEKDKFVLAKFSSSKGKKTYKYVCQIEDVIDEKFVVQGFKSFKKNTQVFRIIDNDHSIIDKNDIISYLPDPQIKGSEYIFPCKIDVVEY